MNRKICIAPAILPAAPRFSPSSSSAPLSFTLLLPTIPSSTLASIIPSLSLSLSLSPPLLSRLTPLFTLPLLRAWGGRLLRPTNTLYAFERG